MRVVTGSLIQESNTFSPVKSDLAFFRAGLLLFDHDSLARSAGTRTELGGFIAASQRAGVTLVPTLAAWAASAGPMDGADFAWLAKQFLRRVRAAGPVGGVLLALHGAWVSDSHEDADGWLLAQVRRIVGPTVPIVATLDLHANITDQMMEAADALVGFRTYPHVDMCETGERAAELLFRALRTGIRPEMVMCKAPLLLAPENAQTSGGPLSTVVDELHALESSRGYLAASVFPVQPWLDVAELGCALLLVTDGQHPAQAHDDAARLADLLWSQRREFHVPLVTPRDAVAQALAAPAGPVLLVDSADGVSSGAPGDSTAILGALLEAQPHVTALVTLVDPPGARQAASADGQEVTLSVGGRLDPQRHQPVEVRGVARRARQSQVTFTSGIGDGLTAEMGSAAVIEVGTIRLLLMERPVPCYDPELYRAAGLEPADAGIVVVKSPNNFRWTYRDIARDWIYVDAPGASSPRLRSLSYTRAPRPLYPLDEWSWRAPRSG